MFTLKNIIVSFFTIFLLLSFHCTVPPKLTPMQKRQITTRAIEAPYEEVFQATLTVIQDEGCNVKNTDMESGLILAEQDPSLEVAPAVNVALKVAGAFLDSWADESTDEKNSFTVSCMVTGVNKTTSEVRINIHKTVHREIRNTETKTATVEEETEKIYDEEMYRDLFNKIIIEVERRQAMK